MMDCNTAVLYHSRLLHCFHILVFHLLLQMQEPLVKISRFHRLRNNKLHTFPKGNFDKNSAVLLVLPKTKSGGSQTQFTLASLYSAAIRTL